MDPNTLSKLRRLYNEYNGLRARTARTNYQVRRLQELETEIRRMTLRYMPHAKANPVYVASELVDLRQDGGDRRTGYRARKLV